MKNFNSYWKNKNYRNKKNRKCFNDKNNLEKLLIKTQKLK